MASLEEYFLGNDLEFKTQNLHIAPLSNHQKINTDLQSAATESNDHPTVSRENGYTEKHSHEHEQLKCQKNSKESKQFRPSFSLEEFFLSDDFGLEEIPYIFNHTSKLTNLSRNVSGIESQPETHEITSTSGPALKGGDEVSDYETSGPESEESHDWSSDENLSPPSSLKSYDTNKRPVCSVSSSSRSPLRYTRSPVLISESEESNDFGEAEIIRQRLSTAPSRINGNSPRRPSEENHHGAKRKALESDLSNAEKRAKTNPSDCGSGVSVLDKEIVGKDEELKSTELVHNEIIADDISNYPELAYKCNTLIPETYMIKDRIKDPKLIYSSDSEPLVSLKRSRTTDDGLGQSQAIYDAANLLNEESDTDSLYYISDNERNYKTGRKPSHSEEVRPKSRKKKLKRKKLIQTKKIGPESEGTSDNDDASDEVQRKKTSRKKSKSSARKTRKTPSSRSQSKKNSSHSSRVKEKKSDKKINPSKRTKVTGKAHQSLHSRRQGKNRSTDGKLHKSQTKNPSVRKTSSRPINTKAPPRKKKSEKLKQVAKNKSKSPRPLKKAKVALMSPKGNKEKESGMVKTGSLFALSELDHAWNSILPVSDLLTFEKKLHEGAKQSRPTFGLSSLFRVQNHPGGVWQSIIDED